MEVITIDTEAFKELTTKINMIAKFVAAQQARLDDQNNVVTDGWVDGYEVCTFLKISNRTLQRLRSSHIINYSLIRGKAYYRISEIQRLMSDNIIRCSEDKLQDLIKNHKLHVDQRRDIR